MAWIPASISRITIRATAITGAITGASVFDVAQSCLDMLGQFGPVCTEVRCNFNGTDLIAQTGDTPARVVNRWREEFDRKVALIFDTAPVTSESTPNDLTPREQTIAVLAAQVIQIDSINSYDEAIRHAKCIIEAVKSSERR